MRSRFPTLAVLATLALGLGFAAPTGTTAAASAPAAARAAVSADAQQPVAEQAQYRERGRHFRRDRDWRGRDWRHNRRHWDRDWRYERRHYRPRSGIYFHFGTPGPRYAPPPRRAYGLPRGHVNWCHARYRSYRAWDNTFQPYHGPRRQCVSPYV